MDVTIPQAGVLAVHDGQVCLITSRRSGRWVIPKGMIDPGQTPIETADAEAWEEAGLIGEINPRPLGSFRYQKFGRTYRVTVYRMIVTEIHDDFPEQPERDRAWMDRHDAAEQVEEEELKRLIREYV